MLSRLGSALKWLGKKVGKGAKEVGKGTIWVFTRPEARLIASFVPLPGLRTAIEIVNEMSKKDLLGSTKMIVAIQKLREDPLYMNMKDSELRWLLETALQVVEGRIEYQERRDEKADT